MNSQEFAAVFFYHIGGDVYTSSSEWVVELMGDIYSEKGSIESHDGQQIPNEEIERVYSSIPSNRKKRILEKAKAMYSSKEKEYLTSLKTSLLHRFPQYAFISDYDGRTALLLNQQTKEKVFLKTIDRYGVNEDLKDVISLYSTLSEKGITVPVYSSGILFVDRKEVGYILSKYVPMTLEEALDKRMVSKKNAYEAVVFLVERLWKMSIYNLDIHLENFLFDLSNKTIYIIDFDTARFTNIEEENFTLIIKHIYNVIYSI